MYTLHIRLFKYILRVYLANNMPFEPRVKLRKVGNSFTITIPVDIVKDLTWREGDVLRIGLEDEKLIIHKEGKSR